MDNEPAVAELLAGDAEAVKALLHAKGGKMFVPGMKGSKTPGAKKEAPSHRREPLGQKLSQYAEGMSPLMAAMTFASVSVVTKLLDAGAPVERDGMTLLGQRPCTFRGAVIAGKHENVTLFLSRYPQYTNMIDKMNYCPLHFVAFSSQCLGQAETMRALLEAGAKPTVTQEASMTGSVLSTACATYDQDPAFIKMLLEAGADATKPETLPGIVKVMRPLSLVFRALGNVQMRGMRTILNGHPGVNRLTPAHIAGARGDIATVQLLAQHSQCNTHTLKDAKGRTPVDMCAAATAPSRKVSQLMQKAVDAAVPSAAAAAPPVKASANKASISAPQVAPYTSK
jgi:ankyrin repeat protein